MGVAIPTIALSVSSSLTEQLANGRRRTWGGGTMCCKRCGSFVWILLGHLGKFAGLQCRACGWTWTVSGTGVHS